MKAILEFNLDDPDDAMEHKRCVYATQIAIILWDLVHNTKKQMEHLIEADSKLTAYDMVDKYHQTIIEALDEQGVIIDKLID
jgi:hypothetical protein